MEQCSDMEHRGHRGQGTLLREVTIRWMEAKYFAKMFPFPQENVLIFLFSSNIKLVEIRNGARSKTLN